MKKLITFISIGLIVTIALAAELQSFYKAKFSGLNSSVNVRLLQDDEAYDLSNFSLDEIGSIKERDLFGQYNSTYGIFGSNFFTGLFKHYTTSSKFFFACAGTKIGLGTAGSFTDISPSNSTVIANSYYSGITFNDRFYLFNPKDEPYVYIGIGNFHKLGNTSAIPGSNCSYSAVHKARIWAASSETYPYRLYFSSLNKAEDWVSTGGYADLPDMTQTITGIISWGGYLYVFTETNIYILLGSTPNDFSLRKTNSMVGAIAPRSIKVTDIGICYLSRSGVYAFDGNNSNKISTKIEGTISSISKTLINNACGIYDGRKYWLSHTLQGSSYNNQIMIYDIYLKDWTIYRGEACDISYFERAYGGTDKGELYGGSSINNGFVYQLQALSGTETITHSTEIDFNAQVTNNTVISVLPSVVLKTGQDTYTKLLCHFDGADGATTYTAETGQVATFFDNAQLDTAFKKYGSASYLGNGADDYITFPDSDDWIFGTGKFTIDCWVKFDVLGSYVLVGQSAGVNDRWAFYQDVSGRLSFYAISGGVTAVEFYTTSSWNPQINTWYHLSVVRDGTTAGSWYMFVNGVSKPITLGVGDWSNSLPNIVSDLSVGAYGSIFELDGNLDEMRISKGIARWTSNFNPPSTHEYSTAFNYGTLTSQNLQINASGTSTLGKITWLGSYPTNTKIAFQTRTGTTNDTVGFCNWTTWTSANTVNFNTVSDNVVGWSASSANINLNTNRTPQGRDILYYETDNRVSPNCIKIAVNGAVSKNEFVYRSVPTRDLSGVNWLTGWFKSPQTGNTVEFSMGENTVTDNIVTFNTVQANTWERWHWYIGGITSTDRDAITKVAVTYKGDTVGDIYIGESWGQNYYEDGDIISSSPNDYIQYRAILGSESAIVTPELTSLTLTYTPSLLVSESSLSSYYYTKWFDFKTPQLNKQFDSMVLEANSTTSSSCILYCDYDIDFGLKTGTFSFPITTTANTVRLFKNFPSSISGKAMRLKIYNNDKDAQVTVKGCEIRYRQESATPD